MICAEFHMSAKFVTVSGKITFEHGMPNGNVINLTTHDSRETALDWCVSKAEQLLDEHNAVECDCREGDEDDEVVKCGKCGKCKFTDPQYAAAIRASSGFYASNIKWNTRLDMKFVDRREDWFCTIVEEDTSIESVVDRYPLSSGTYVVGGRYVRLRIRHRGANSGDEDDNPTFENDIRRLVLDMW